jgi:hypothetical protein
MKKCMFLFLIISLNLFAQEFVVDKISGSVSVMKDTEEEWTQVKSGQKLTKNDLVSTSEKSYIQLSSKDSKFLLKSNSAVNLSAIKKMTLNELILALAAEEIRNIPSNKKNGNMKNTAVYGKEENSDAKVVPETKELGIKKINGAKQLAENGFKESALVVAKETFRKYPNTKQNLSDRLYFVDQMINLKLRNEASAEINDMKNYKPALNILKELDTRLEKLKQESYTDNSSKK